LYLPGAERSIGTADLQVGFGLEVSSHLWDKQASGGVGPTQEYLLHDHRNSLECHLCKEATTSSRLRDSWDVKLKGYTGESGKISGAIIYLKFSKIK
jgi:hypothetical protein